MRALAVLMAAMFLPGCLMDALYGNLPDTVRMDPGVIALRGLNGPHDDFNAVAGPPPLAMDAFIVFASNDASGGRRFRIDAGRLALRQDPFPGRRQKIPPRPVVNAQRLGPFDVIPETGGDVRGPSPLFLAPEPVGMYEKSFAPYETKSYRLTREPLPADGGGRLPAGGVWMFDSNHEGRRNLYFVDAAGKVRPFFGNRPDADDAYAAYDFAAGELLFCSNRSGQYRLYRYRNRGGSTDFDRWLGDRSLAQFIEPVAELPVAGQTMCPFVDGDDLFFASDRPGGLGGFDLYVCRRTPQGWGPPRNLREAMPPGVGVNTPGNEFRPSVLALGLRSFKELRVLMFSSDRPGGAGGYDLYVTALPEEAR